MNPIEYELLSGASLVSPKATRRRFVASVGGSPLELPGEQVDLLRRWLKPQQARRKWPTLLADAGSKKIEAAMKLRDWLLRNGWAEIIERRAGSHWETNWLLFPRLNTLRDMFQLPDSEILASQWIQAASYQFDDGDLSAAHAALATLPLARRLQRFALLVKMESWCYEQRQGTRRDFALHARGDTKAITAAEWVWLEVAVDLQKAGIFEHTPHLLIAGPIRLYSLTSVIDLNASTDWVALTPETIAAMCRSEGLPNVWRLVENRTSFERVARARTPDQAVVWLPGYPPSWWTTAMDRLLQDAPGAAEIACDPDPDGVAIALQAAAIWEKRGLPWSSFAMAADDLKQLVQRKRLNEHDQQLLQRLLSGDLPPSLRTLALKIHELGEKGEQEAYL